MDKDEDIDEGYDKYEEDDVTKEEISTELDEAKKEDKEEVKEVEEVEEAKKEEIEEEIDLDELLAELEEGKDKDEVKESEEIEESEEVTEEEEVEAEEGEDEEAEGEMEEEEVDLEDMTEDDLKSFIEDVIKDMVEAGELEAGEEMESEDEESEEEIDIEAEDEEEEIMEMDEVSWNEKNNPTRGASKQELDPKKVGKSTAAYAINEEKEEVEELRPGYAVGELNPENNDLLKAISFIGKQARKAGKSVADFVADIELGKMSDAIGEGEDLDEIEELKKELQEVNLLNAKLLYTNKIFKAKNLTESKKVKVLKAFDKAKDVRQAKTIFETLSEGLLDKSPINESIKKGAASKASGLEPKAAKQPIIESNDVYNRMRKLAGLL